MDILFGEHLLIVAGVTEVGLGGDEELVSVRRVRMMAVRAAHCDGGMDAFPGEHRSVVTGVAQVRLAGGKELFSVRRMRVMAARAAHCDGGMDIFPGEHRFVVTGVAKVRLIRRKPPGPGVRLFMGHVFGDDPRMADRTPDGCLQRPMQDLSFFPSFVTSHTPVFLGESRESEDKKDKQRCRTYA
jgi:hypothetical protein